MYDRYRLERINSRDWAEVRRLQCARKTSRFEHVKRDATAAPAVRYEHRSYVIETYVRVLI